MKLWQSGYNPQCKLSQQDLLDISAEITQTFAPHNTHHQPELVLMPVDPINLYAYWNLSDSETNNSSNHVNKQLALRIYSIPEISEHSSKLQLSFEINVDGFKNQQKVHLPLAATAYSAVIGEINIDGSFSSLATANIIHVPRENPISEKILNGNENTLQIEQTLEKVPVVDQATQDNPSQENSLNSTKNTVQALQTMEKELIPESNSQNTQPEAFILPNFNDYGYDLKVYENELNPEIKNILTKQNNNIQLNTEKTNTIDKNTSSQGHLL